MEHSECHLKIKQLGWQHHALLWHMESSLKSRSPKSSLHFCFQLNFLRFPYHPNSHYMVLIWSLSLVKENHLIWPLPLPNFRHNLSYCHNWGLWKVSSHKYVFSSRTTTGFVNDQSLHTVYRSVATVQDASQHQRKCVWARQWHNSNQLHLKYKASYTTMFSHSQSTQQVACRPTCHLLDHRFHTAWDSLAK